MSQTFPGVQHVPGTCARKQVRGEPNGKEPSSLGGTFPPQSWPASAHTELTLTLRRQSLELKDLNLNSGLKIQKPFQECLVRPQGAMKNKARRRRTNPADNEMGKLLSTIHCPTVSSRWGPPFLQTSPILYHVND